MSNDTTETPDTDMTLYCIECGQLLDRNDDRCFTCGEYQ